MPEVQWITKSLQSVEPKILHEVKITISTPDDFLNPLGEVLRRELVDLDHLLVKLWTPHSFVLRIRGKNIGGRSLLPEITGREGVRGD